MVTSPMPSKLTDPEWCLRAAEQLIIPVSPENCHLVKEDAHELNVLQAAIAHLVYLDTEQTEFQEKALEIVFTAYLMGRMTGRQTGEAPEAFAEFLSALDFTGMASLSARR